MGSIFYSLVIYPLTQIIELVFCLCKKLFDNTGFAILGVSFAVSLLTLPLYVVAEHWQQVERDKQKSMKSEIDKIKAVFKGNEQYMILSTYYRQQHYHPIMALRSAFGLLIQIPFFTAAYTCLSNMTALQGHSLLFIRDLGAPDSLFTIGSFHVNVLPIAMTLINMISGTIYTKGLPLRDKIQTYGLALLFVVILYDSPAGLVAYWTLNNLFSLVKNVFYKLKHPVWTLYAIACAAVAVLDVWLFAGHVLAFKRAVLVAGCFSLVFFAPLFVKAANYLVDNTFSVLRDSFKLRLGLFITSAAGLTLLTGLLIPTLLIASSPEEFSGIDGILSPNFYIGNTFSQAAGIFIIWCSLIFFLYHERMQTLLSFGLACLLGMSLLNCFVFAEDYGYLSKLLKFTEVTDLDSPALTVIINVLAMAAVIAFIALAVKFKFAKQLNFVFAFVSLGLIFVSVINESKISKGFNSYKEKIVVNKNQQKEIEPIFHFSKTGKNVLFIFLDRAQNRFVEPLFEECPEVKEQFKGFTLYENAVSFNAHTLLGSPPCFGGYEYTPQEMNTRKDETLVSKTNESILYMPRIFTEQGENFSAVATDPSWANYSWIPDLSIYSDYPAIKSYITDGMYTDIWYKEHQDTANLNVVSATLKRNILWYSMLRSSPLVLRPAFYNSGNYWSTNKSNTDYNDYLDGYAVLEYLSRLTDFNCQTENSFISFVNNTTHDGLFLQAPEYRPAAEVTNFGTSEYAKDNGYHSFAGAMRRVGEWFEFLKANDCWDNTRIVIVADHGASRKESGYNWDSDFEKIGPGRYHPLLMFKDFNSNEEFNVSSDFMTSADASVLLIDGVIENPVNPFTGKEVSSSEKENGILVCTSDIFMPYHNSGNYVFDVNPGEWYRVKDNIFDSSNWTMEDFK